MGIWEDQLCATAYFCGETLFFPQFLLAEIWVFDLFKMQSDSSTPESEREVHDCATKFEGLNAVTQWGRAVLHLKSRLGYGDTITSPRVMLIFQDGVILMPLHSLPHLNEYFTATVNQSLKLKSPCIIWQFLLLGHSVPKITFKAFALKSLIN